MHTYEQIISALKKEVYAPIYFLCGEENFYIDAISNFIEKNILDDVQKTFDMTILYGKDMPSNDIIAAVLEAKTVGMMGRKIVLVKEAQTLKKWDALADYLLAPQPNNILCICYKYGVPDKPLKIFKDLDKRCVMMQSNKLRDNEVSNWIIGYIREWNATQQDAHGPLTIDEKVAQILADYLGNDLTKIVGELNKLISGRPAGTQVIDAQLVERNVGISKDFNIFELQTALIQSDVLKANRIVDYFADSKDHPIQKELSVLYNFFANLMIFHYLDDKSDRAAASKLGINPFFVKDYRAAAKRFTAGKTMKIIEYICDTDAKSKGIDNLSATAGDLWKELIFRILH